MQYLLLANVVYHFAALSVATPVHIQCVIRFNNFWQLYLYRLKNLCVEKRHRRTVKCCCNFILVNNDELDTSLCFTCCLLKHAVARQNEMSSNLRNFFGIIYNNNTYANMVGEC